LSVEQLAAELDRISTSIEAETERRDQLREQQSEHYEVIRARVEEILEDEDATAEEIQATHPTAGEQERLDRLMRGVANANARIDALRNEHLDLVRSHAAAEEKKAEIIRGMAGGGFRTESGDGATALAARSQSHAGIAGIISSRKAPHMRNTSSPWGYADTVRRAWDFNGDIPTGGEVMRANARRILEAIFDDEDITIDADRAAEIDEIIARSDSIGDNVALWMVAASNPHWYTAFQKSLRNPTTGHYAYTDDERRAAHAADIARAAMSLTDANGGLLVPQTLDPSIVVTNSGIADPIRSIATVKQIATNDWSGATSAGVNAEWLGEGSEAADASPTFTQPVITPKKGAAWVFGSHEVLSDSGFAADLPGLLADGKARLEGAAFATGNVGATRPRGVVAAVAAVTASIVTSTTTSALVKDDIYRVADALRPRDASQASWIANKRIYSLVRQFDTAGGSSFWANLGMGVPAQLLGQPQYECSTMGSVVTTGANVLLVGNFKMFYVIDRIGSQMYYEPLVKGSNARPTGQAGWYFYFRSSSDVVDPDAFRLLQLSTTAAFTALA
jgi:HK97 family phage major capsid protein